MIKGYSKGLTEEQILSEISDHGHQRAYDLHKKMHISTVAIHKQLRKLLALGKIKKIGSAPYVAYTLPDRNTPNLIELEKMKKKILPVLKKAHVVKAALFGSYVRGDNTKDSDIDVLLELPREATLLDLVGIKQDMEEKLKKKVDVVEYEGIHPLFKESILKNQYSLL